MENQGFFYVLSFILNKNDRTGPDPSSPVCFLWWQQQKQEKTRQSSSSWVTGSALEVERHLPCVWQQLSVHPAPPGTRGVCHSLQSAALTALCALPRLRLQCWCLHLGTRSNPHPRKSNIIAFLFLKLELWLFLEMLKACIKPVVEISFTKDELTTLPCSVDTEKN